MNKRQQELTKAMPFLVGKKVDINGGNYIGTVDKFTGLYLVLKNVTRWNGEFLADFDIHTNWITKIKIVE